MTIKKYQALNTAIQAADNCRDTKKEVWLEKWEKYIKSIMDTAPSGGGIDCGTKINWTKTIASNSCRACLVFDVQFHHMNSNGYYDGWTEHKVIVRPSFSGIDITITGRNRNEIKEYLHEVYYFWLNEDFKNVNEIQ